MIVIKKIFLGLIGCVLFVALFIGYLLYFNDPPQGAVFDSFIIDDPEVEVYENPNGTSTVEVNGTIFFVDIIPDNPYDPTPLKMIIDIKTNETLGIDQRIVASKTLFLNMTYRERYPFSEKLIIVKENSYRIVISFFALQPNNFWGTHWELVGRQYFYLDS